MKNIFKYTILMILFSFLNQLKVNAQVPTDKELEEKRKNLPFSYHESLKFSLSKIDKMNLNDVKSNSKKYLKDFDKQYAKKIAYRKDYYNGLNKHYNIEEEKFSNYEFVLEPEKDTIYIKTLTRKIFFEQVFESDSTFINTIDFSGSENRRIGLETIHAMSLESYDKTIVNTVYYNDGTTKTDFKEDIDCPYFSGKCLLDDSLKHIDSIKTTYELYYLTKIDSIFIDKEDVGKVKKGIEVLSIDNNEFKYEGVHNDILEIYAYNSQGKKLESTSSNVFLRCRKNIEVEKEFDRKYLKLEIEALKGITNKKDALKILESNLIDRYLDCGYKHGTNYNYFAGNIDKIKIIKENKWDTLRTKLTFINYNPINKFYLNSSKTGTKFINAKGKTLFTSPYKELLEISANNYSQINYFYYQSTSGINALGNGFDSNYYHLDINSKTLKKLEDIESIRTLNKELVVIFNLNREGFIYNNKNKKVTSKAYSSIEPIGNLIKVANLYSEFDLLDAKGKSTELKSINKISKFYNGIAKIEKGEKFNFITTEGELLFLTYFDSKNIYSYSNESFAELQVVKKGEYYGIVDLNNSAKITVPIEYKRIFASDSKNNSPLYIINKDLSESGYGIIDTQGKVLAPQKYTRLQINEMLYNLED